MHGNVRLHWQAFWQVLGLGLGWRGEELAQILGLALEEGGGGSAMTTLDKKACEGRVW